MLKQVKHMGISAFNDYQPGPNEIAISIGWDGDETRPRMHEDWSSFIRVSFSDLDEEKIKQPVGSIPDLHPRYEHGDKLLFAEKYPLCDYNDALRVVGLLDKYHKMKGDWSVVVHCHAGVSRSGATANFIMLNYGAGIDHVEPMDVINNRWFRLLSKAKKGLEPEIFIPSIPERDYYAGKIKI